jgi:hypothetical protein
MNPTSYSIIPPKVMCHMVNLTSTFGEGPRSSCLVDGMDTTLTLNWGTKVKYRPQGLNLVGKYSSELWASKQAH